MDDAVGTTDRGSDRWTCHLLAFCAYCCVQPPFAYVLRVCHRPLTRQCWTRTTRSTGGTSPFSSPSSSGAWSCSSARRTPRLPPCTSRIPRARQVAAGHGGVIACASWTKIGKKKGPMLGIERSSGFVTARAERLSFAATHASIQVLHQLANSVAAGQPHSCANHAHTQFWHSHAYSGARAAKCPRQPRHGQAPPSAA